MTQQQPPVLSDLDRGVYPAERAAALAGVPRRTLSHWAQTGLLVPSISPERVRLWSWADLLALRAIDRLRHGDNREGGRRTSTQHIRQALRMLHERGVGIDQVRDRLLVDRMGHLYVRMDGATVCVEDGTQQVAEVILDDLVAAYNGAPDLLRPGPRLRIVPGKLSGEPHIEGTRISTASVYALREGGYTVEQMLGFYPEVTAVELRSAVELEERLQHRAA